MNISLSKSDLISALQIVSKGLSTKPQTPILSGVYMTAKEGLLELQSTNYELGFIVTIPAKRYSPGNIAPSSSASCPLRKSPSPQRPPTGSPSSNPVRHGLPCARWR